MNWAKTIIFFWAWIVVLALLFSIPIQSTITGAAVLDNSLGTSVRARSVSSLVTENQDVIEAYTNDRHPDHVFMYVKLTNDAREITSLFEGFSILLYEAYPNTHETIYLHIDHDIVGEANYNKEKGTLDISVY